MTFPPQGYHPVASDRTPCHNHHVHSEQCCKYFVQDRWCRHGNHCRFLHCQPNAVDDGPDARSPSGYYSSGAPAPPPRYDSYVDNQGQVQDFRHLQMTNWRATPEATEDYIAGPTSSIGHQHRHHHHPVNETVRYVKRSTDHFIRAGLSVLSPRHHHHHHRNDDQPPMPIARKQCSYFANGYCRKGDRCHYVHDLRQRRAPVDANERWDVGKRPAAQVQVQAHPLQVIQPRAPVAKPTAAALLAELSEQQLHELRSVEIEQLEKRFPAAIREELGGGSDSFVVSLAASDPDWPYDVRMVSLRITFHEDYPKSCPDAAVEEKNNVQLPPLLSKHLTRSTQTWLKETHANNVASGKAELIFRPFVRWFDRAMEDLFTEGLRMVKRNLDAEAAGIKFVPFEQLMRPCQSDDVVDSDDDDDDEEEEDYEEDENDEEEEEGEEEDDEDGDVPRKEDLQQTLYPKLEELSLLDDLVNRSAIVKQASNLTVSSAKPSMAPSNKDSSKPKVNFDFRAAKKGTEVSLRNLQLSETVASAICQKIHVTVQCARCKTKHDVVTDPKRRNGMPCKKCHGDQVIAFRPNLMHQYSAVLGYLDLDGCSAFDLPIVDCLFAVDCLACNKPLRCEGINYGQPWTSHCHTCNNKMTVYVDSAKFTVLQSNKDKREKAKRSKGDSGAAIQEGRPLPSNGTCRHYKKSYRWFRFPCCGKCYPCDLCHNEKEVEHEMKFATRVICGFCAKEQPFSSKTPCVVCGSTFNHVGKGHWEGGKGCRDKVRMNREDSHKYSGLGKTVSRKTKEAKESKGKKKSTSSKS